MIVADASIFVEALLTKGELASTARAHLDSADVHAPHLVDLEVASALRRLAVQGIVSPDRARGALRQLSRALIYRHSHAPFLDRIWELRSSIGAYDAAYVALAERAETKLVTLDRRLAAAHGPRCEIQVLGN